MSAARDVPPHRLVVLSGPSGVGKSTVGEHLLARPEFARVVTATTRAPRGAERTGIDYHFLDDATFDHWVAEKRFLEWATVHANRYGSPRAAAAKILRNGQHALLIIDVQGAASVRASGMGCVTVFLLPPSNEELERRLRGRGTDDEATIQRRLAGAHAELARQNEFDLRVCNDDAARAAAEIATRIVGGSA